MNRSDADIVAQIICYCDKINDRIATYSIDEAAFMENEALVDMLLMPVFQIGELAGALSQEFRDNHPHIPWRAIRGLRNVITHDYGVVDPLWAWNTIRLDIPALRAVLEEGL